MTNEEVWATGDEAELVRRNEGLLYRQAAKWARLGRLVGMGVEELLQEARVACVRAARAYDPAKAKFSTWCARYAFNACSHAVAVAGLKNSAGRRRIVAALNGEAPDAAALAAVGAASPAPLVEWLVSDAPSAEALLGDAEERAELLAAMAELPPRERRVLVERFWEGRTLVEVGAGLGVSRERARQLEQRAKARLRSRLEELRT